MQLAAWSRFPGPFIDRVTELSTLARFLSEGARLVIVTGPRGVGKTAFLRAFASQYERAGNTALFISGSALFTPDRLVDAISARNTVASFLGSVAGNQSREGRPILILDDAPLFAADWIGVIRDLDLKWPIVMAVGSEILDQAGERLTNLPDYVLRLQPFTSEQIEEILREYERLIESLPAPLMTTSFDYLVEEALLGSYDGMTLGAVYAIADAEVSRGLLAETRLLGSDSQVPKEQGPRAPTGKLLLPGSSGFNTIADSVARTNRELALLVKSNPKLVYQIDPFEFERLVAELLTGMGYVVNQTPATRDGGLDIWIAEKTDLGSFKYFVECKRLQRAAKVDVRVVRQLFGVVESESATAGVIVTTSSFTADARKYQQKETVRHRMALYDYLTLLGWLQRYH